MNGFFYAAIDRIPLGPAVAIEFLGPLVLAAVLTRRLPDAVWVRVAVIGMGLLFVDGVVGAEPLDPLGVVFILIAAAFWAMYIRTSAKVGAVIPGSGGLAVGLVVAAVLLLPPSLSAQAAAIVCLVAVGLLAFGVQALRPREWAYPAAVIWALAGVIAANWGAGNWPVIAIAVLAAALLALRAVTGSRAS
mgnify:CR=1 FL=1